MPRMIATMINQVARQAVGKDWLLYAALLDHWQEIVGADYARVTTPIKITFPHQPNEPRRQGGILCVRLPKGLTMEFSFKAESIKQRVNSYFGYEAISRVTFDSIHSSAPEKSYTQPLVTDEAKNQATAGVKDIPNGELRDTLQSFGQTLLSSKDKDDR